MEKLSELAKLKQALDADEVRELHRLRTELQAKTEAFEGLKKLLGTEQDATTQYMENQRLRAENARLLEALKNILDFNLEDDGATCEWTALLDAIKAARAAIAEAEKQQPFGRGF